MKVLQKWYCPYIKICSFPESSLHRKTVTFVVSPLFYHILIALSKEYFFTLAIHLYLRQVIHKTAILQVVFCCLVKCFGLCIRFILGNIRLRQWTRTKQRWVLIGKNRIVRQAYSPPALDDQPDGKKRGYAIIIL